MAPGKPPPRPGKLPHAIAGDEQPERAAVKHTGVDGAPQRAPDRRGTLPGMPALKPPPVPTELAPTKPAPPAPPIVVTPVVPSLEQSEQSEAQELRERNAWLEGQLRQRQAAEKAAAETFPPASVPSKVIRQTPEPSEPPPSTSAWKKALFQLVVGLGACLTALATILGVRAANMEPKVQKIEDDKGREALSDYAVRLAWYEYDAKVRITAECRWKHDARSFKMLLPAPDKMGSALKMEPFIGDEVCPDWPPLPEKPQAPAPPPKK